MIKTVYFLVHRDTNEKLRFYHSRNGARIAQRQRNHRLGFIERVSRTEIRENCEVELCKLPDGSVVEATWCIEEGLIEQEDFYG
jgi:hypothetical protein